MQKATVKTNKKSPDSVILIVDKIGVIGEKLSQEYSKDFVVILVTKRKIKKIENVSTIFFGSKVPKAPSNNYKKIFIIDDGENITKQTSKAYLKESIKLNSEIYFLENIRNIDIKYLNKLTSDYEKAKALILGDLFSDEYLFDNNSNITKFLKGVRDKKKILITGDGLGVSYPIEFQDTIKLIIKATYINIPHRILFLFYQYPITDLSLAHIFQKIDPDVDIDFSKVQKHQVVRVPKGGEYALGEYNLKNRIGSLDLRKDYNLVNNSKKIKKSNLKNFKVIFFLFILTVFMLLLPLLSTLTFEAIGKYQLKESIKLANNNDFDKALRKIDNSKMFFDTAMGSSEILISQAELLNFDNSVKLIVTRISVEAQLTSIISDLFNGLLKLKYVSTGDSVKPLDDFMSGIQDIKNAYLKIQTVSDSDQLKKLMGEEIYEKIGLIDLLFNLDEVLIEVLGFGHEKTYLILFHNNNELRGGGGSIMAIAKVVVREGSVEEFEIKDINELNEKQNSQVESPNFLRRYTALKNLNLENSSYDPNFKINAITTASIFNSITGDEIDGVIGVDLIFLEELLKISGPIKLDNYELEINSDNLLEVMSIDRGDNLMPIIVSELYKNISDNNTFDSMLNVIAISILNKNIIFSFEDGEIQKIFEVNNLTGSINNFNKKENEINDYIGLSESNVGGNNINYFINREIIKENILSSDGGLSSSVTIVFENTKDRNEKDNTYTSYIKLMFPRGSIINEISVGGVKQNVIPAVLDPTVFENAKFVNPEGLEIEQSVSDDVSLFGFLVNVEADSRQAIKVNYSLPFELLEDSSTNYSLFVYKQPGVRNLPFSLTFDTNDEFIVLPKKSYSTNVVNDEKIDFIISPR